MVLETIANLIKTLNLSLSFYVIDFYVILIIMILTLTWEKYYLGLQVIMNSILILIETIAVLVNSLENISFIYNFSSNTNRSLTSNMIIHTGVYV